MLVTMVFQTLYFLVDLYWVGRLGKEAVAGVAIAGNLTFIVLAITQMLGVGVTTLVSHAAGPEGPGPRAARLQPVADPVGAGRRRSSAPSAMAVRVPYANALGGRRDDRRARGRLSPLVHSRHGAAVRHGQHERRAARHGNFKPGMVVQTATVILNIVLAPFLIFGWARPGPRRGRRGDLIARRRGRRLGVAVVLLRGEDVVSQVRARRLEAADRDSGERCSASGSRPERSSRS